MINKKNCRRCGITIQQTPLCPNRYILCNKCYIARGEELKLIDVFYNVPSLMKEGVELILQGLVQTYPNLKKDMESQHMAQTPSRVARMFIELCVGLAQDPKVHMTTAFEESDYGGIVLVKNIQFVSLCMHHMVPFKGVAHVGYIPNGKIVGLSKINRIVEIIAARPQVQERLTRDIVHLIQDTLKPKGVMGVIQARHDCIEIRGVKSKGSSTVTSELTGIFIKNSKNCKEEFLNLINEDLSKL